MEPSFPLAHDSAVHLCSVCGAPDVPGLACFCVSETLDLCDASCPECREIGLVNLSAVIPGDYDEEPLPLLPRPKSWWPTAAE